MIERSRNRPLFVRWLVARVDERKSRAIELKYFGGMTTEEIGSVLGIAVATVGRELRLGQAWLRRELSRAQE